MRLSSPNPIILGTFNKFIESIVKNIFQLKLIETWQTGMYFIKVQNGDFRGMKRLMKQ